MNLTEFLNHQITVANLIQTFGLYFIFIVIKAIILVLYYTWKEKDEDHPES